MGQDPDPRKRAEQGPDAPETVRFPSPAIRPRLINSDGFDKAGESLVQQLLRVAPANRWYGDYSSQSPQIDARMSALCTNIKSGDVTIYGAVDTDKKKPGMSRAFQFRDDRPCDQAADAGVNFATMPSSGLNACLARSP
jgi:hypothetical protein